MSGNAERMDRWQNLVNAAFLLDEAKDGAGPVRVERARAALENVLEVFPGSLDPVDDFEAWAVRRLALALHRTLQES